MEQGDQVPDQREAPDLDWTVPRPLEPHLAETAEDLHQTLVLHPVRTGWADASEPYSLFVKHHEREPGQSIATATLLLTDGRWSNAARPLMIKIEESGLLTDDALDLLARAFLAADDAVYWAVPDVWFEGGLEIELTTNAAADQETSRTSRTLSGAATRPARPSLVGTCGRRCADGRPRGSCDATPRCGRVSRPGPRSCRAGRAPQ